MRKYRPSRPSQCPVMRGFKSTGETVLIRCKQWSCPHCQKILARMWARRCYKHLDALHTRMSVNDRSGVAAFITFTLPIYVRNAEAGYKLLPKLWNTFRMRMRRAYGADWQYIAFVEGQQKTRGGMPHFHIISTKPLPIEANTKGYTAKRKLSQFAVAIGFGFKVDQQIMSDKRASSYVSKYASKQDKSIPRGSRRVRASQDWYKDEKKSRKPYIVPAKGEDLARFIDRVAVETGISHETLASRWIDAALELERAQGLTKS